jgi:multiple sugar transport system permease protein
MIGARRDQRNGLLFISPWIVGFLVFTAYPILSSLFYSLTRYNVVDPPKFIGLGNYIDLLTTDLVFRTSLLNTLYMVIVGTIVITIATLSLALILSNKRIKGLSVFRRRSSRSSFSASSGSGCCSRRPA